jgi:hypothetical protein
MLEGVGSQSMVEVVSVNDAGELIVGVSQTPVHAARYPGIATYRIDRDLHLLHVDLNQGFEAAHSSAVRDGLVDHAMGEADQRILRAVRRWDGTRFLPVAQAAGRDVARPAGSTRPR